MKHFSFRYLLSLALAMLLCGTAGAVPQTDVEQSLASDKEAVYQADTVEQTEIDGKQTIVKTFELPPDADPEALRESAFAQGGYKFVWERTDKTEIMGENKKNAEETFSMETATKDTEKVVAAFPPTRKYEKDGYTGTLTLDKDSVKTEVAKYNTVKDSHAHEATKKYTRDAKDESLIPDSIVQDGVKLPLSSLSWAKVPPEEGSDAPTKWTATAVYSATTYTERKVESGYRASAVYKGEVSKEAVKSVKYTVSYTGEKIPVVANIPYEVLHPEMSAKMKAGIGIVVLIVIALIVYIVWYARQHTGRAFIVNDQDNQDNQDTPTATKTAASIHYVSATKPRLRLQAQCYDETLYEIVLPKRLAQKLVGKDITIESRTGTQTHTVRAFSGDKYSFRVIISGKSKYESL